MLTNNNNRMWLVQHSAKGVHLTQEKQTLESVLRQHNAWVKSERCTQRKVKKKTEITSGKHAQFVSWVSEFKVNWLQKEEECIDSQNWRVEESGGHLRRRLGQVRSGDSNIIFISLSLSFLSLPLLPLLFAWLTSSSLIFTHGDQTTTASFRSLLLTAISHILREWESSAFLRAPIKPKIQVALIWLKICHFPKSMWPQR